MKTIKPILFFLFIAFGLTSMGQTFVWESFDAGQMPPAGWTLNGIPAQWGVNNSDNAGGTAPEAQFTYVQQTTTTRLISPMFDLTGVTIVTLSFRHMYDWYSNPAPKVGVATRSHNGTWNTVWEKSPTANIAKEKVDVVINNTDVGQSEFQICFYLNGNMYNLDYWYLDNILLFNPLNLDAGLISVGATQNYFAEPLAVKGTLMNLGTTTITGAEVKYSVDGGPAVSTTLSGLSIPTQGMYDFSFNQPYAGAIGPHDLTVWIDKVNGVADDDPSNDTLSKTVYKICYVVPRTPLYEEFTSSTCSPCASFNSTFVPWCNTNEDSITLIKYQMSWPSPGDPYYTLEGGVRRSFYGVNAVPDLYVNGGNTATTMAGVTTAFTQAKKLIGMMSIAGTHSMNDKVISLKATILPFSDFNNVKVYIVVMEKITHNNVMSNGETSFEHVMMKMVPDAEGTLTNLVDRVPFTITDTVDLSGTHIEEFNDLIVGIFVQDPATKEVYQSAYSVENAQFSSEARLSNIATDGTSVSGFSPDQMDYTVYLAGGASSAPFVTATPIEPTETVIIVPTVELPGATTIDVFAENLTDHRLYTVNFDWAIGMGDAGKDGTRLYPNPTRGLVYLYGAGHATVTITDALGHVMAVQPDFSGNTLNLSGYLNGIYQISIEKADGTVIRKKVVIL